MFACFLLVVWYCDAFAGCVGLQVLVGWCGTCKCYFGCFRFCGVLLCLCRFLLIWRFGFWVSGLVPLRFGFFVLVGFYLFAYLWFRFSCFVVLGIYLRGCVLFLIYIISALLFGDLCCFRVDFGCLCVLVGCLLFRFL